MAGGDPTWGPYLFRGLDAARLGWIPEPVVGPERPDELGEPLQRGGAQDAVESNV